MFEAKLAQGILFKKIIEAIKEVVVDANLECSSEGIQLQAMDSAHVSLVSLNLKSEIFDQFRCDRNISLGVNLNSLSKLFKCAGSDDAMTIKADDDGDTVHFDFRSGDGRVTEFQVKLMDIESEHLGIPDTEYKCVVRMPSSEFQRIIRDLGFLDDTVSIGVSKNGVKFSVSGDVGSGSVTHKPSTGSDNPDEHIIIEMEEPTELTFALRYLAFFTKATPLSPTVSLHMSKDVPLMVEFKVEKLGYLRFYLAPKIDDEN